MDHETDNEKPSSKEGGEMKIGDKVWVLCEVATVYSHESLYMDIRHDGAVFEAKRSDCRPEAKMLNGSELIANHNRGIEVQGE
jgi:hypothetical protein